MYRTQAWPALPLLRQYKPRGVPSRQASKQGEKKKKKPLAGEQLNVPLATPAETRCKDFTISVALTLIVSLCLIREDKMCKRRITHELSAAGV